MKKVIALVVLLIAIIYFKFKIDNINQKTLNEVNNKVFMIKNKSEILIKKKESLQK